jgi:hypothetical protein
MTIEDEEQPQQGGLNAIISESEQAGLKVTSGYRSPDDPYQSYIRYQHIRRGEHSICALDKEDADDVMAKQRRSSIREE